MARKETPTAKKLLTIIADFMNWNKDLIEPETTFKSRGVSENIKSNLLKRIAYQFNGMPITDIEIDNIESVWNCLQFVECSHDFKKGKYVKPN